jgi:rhodanese-related sulfurtransferase
MWAEASIVLGIALAATALSWALRSPRLPLVAARDIYEFELKQPLLSAAAALALYEAGSHLFIDTRAGLAASAPRIPGALSLRPEQFDDDFAAIIDFIAPEDPLVLYGESLQASAAVAGRLAERGYAQLSLLEGGLAAWQAAGGPLSRSREESP